MELKKEIRERFSQDVDFPQEMLFGALHEALSKIDGNTKLLLILSQDLAVQIMYIQEF